VSRYLLDTNIICNIIKPMPSEALIAWMAEQADGDLFISALTVAEILRGLLEKPAGKSGRNCSAGSPGPGVRKRCSPAGCSRSTRRLASHGRA
jgi:hypothetical protein